MTIAICDSCCAFWRRKWDHEELARLTHRFAAALHSVTHDVELPRALVIKVAIPLFGTSLESRHTELHRKIPDTVADLSHSIVAIWIDAKRSPFHAMPPGKDRIQQPERATRRFASPLVSQGMQTGVAFAPNTTYCDHLIISVGARQLLCLLTRGILYTRLDTAGWNKPSHLQLSSCGGGASNGRIR
jgi:hypothetical protein